MGVLGMDCECLAGDAYRLFQVYWYLAETRHIPVHWNETFSAEYNMTYPADVLINGTAATAFWAVSVGGLQGWGSGHTYLILEGCDLMCCGCGLMCWGCVVLCVVGVVLCVGCVVLCVGGVWSYVLGCVALGRADVGVQGKLLVASSPVCSS